MEERAERERERAWWEADRVWREEVEARRIQLKSKPGLEKGQTSKFVPVGGEPTEDWVKVKMQERWDLHEVRKTGESSEASSNGILMKSPEEMAKTCHQTIETGRKGEPTFKDLEIEEWLDKTP